MTEISSTQNPKVKILRSLRDKKGRDMHSLFLVEGGNIVKDMPSFYAREIYIKRSCADKYSAIAERSGAPIFVMEDFVFDSVADTETPAGILAVAEIPAPKPLSRDRVLVLDGIKDAGNLGTIIRTAAASDFTDIISVGCADAYNPKTVRATMGGIFHVNLIKAEAEEAINLLREYDIAALDMTGKDIFRYEPPPKLALAVGSEAQGVSDIFLSNAREILALPMKSGKIESLNAAVSVSAAMIVINKGE